MDFDLFDLDNMMKDLLDELSTDVHSDSSSSTVTEHSQPSSLHEQKHDEGQSTMTQDVSDRQYCLIIFNNPRWSQRLRKQSEHTTKQETKSTTRQAEANVVKEEKQDLSLEDQFTIQLRQLFDHYMQHTKRPFPIKYFIDFTRQPT